MTTSSTKKENERTKLIQEKCQTLLTQMLRDEDNKYCVDCDAKGPRWASWNLGVFLCIRCAGIHRNLGVHISRVKSVNLDTWTPEQVISLQQMGNSRARAVYEAQLPDGFRRPQTDTALESFIRAKYEHKKYLAREWVPPSPPKVDWAKEIDEELERQKRKKKAAQAGSALGIGVISSSGASGDKKSNSISSKSSTALPAPLPKPKPGQCGSSPKNHRGTEMAQQQQQQNNDLLGLCSPTKPVQNANQSACNDLQNDAFSGFLSAAPSASGLAEASAKPTAVDTSNSLAKEEEDFFNQGSLSGTTAEKDKSGKLTKDSILALYGNAPSATSNPQLPPNMSFGQQQTQSMFGFTPGGAFVGAGGGMHAQFMTPPNSTSMYNSPVMTAPAAFSASGMSSLSSTGSPAAGGSVFGTQFGNAQGFSHQQQQQQQWQQQGIIPQAATNNLNLMHTNQSLLSGMSMQQPTLQHQQQQQAMQMGGNMMGLNSLSAFQMGTASTSSTMQTAANTNLNQQFGNLNIGNVWQ